MIGVMGRDETYRREAVIETKVVEMDPALEGFFGVLGEVISRGSGGDYTYTIRVYSLYTGDELLTLPRMPSATVARDELDALLSGKNPTLIEDELLRSLAPPKEERYDVGDVDLDDLNF